jgi:hypothetical protein
MDRINELLARLTELTDEEMAELNGLLDAEVDRLADEDVTEETVAALDVVADARDQVTAEVTSRTEAQAALETRREASLNRLRPPVADDQPEDASPDGEGDADGDAPADGDQPAGDAAVDEPEAEAVAASAAARPTRPSMRQLAQTRGRGTTSPRPGQPALRASTRVVSAVNGQELGTRRDVAEAMARAISSGRGPDGQFSIVSASTEFPEARMLRTGHDATNEALVAAAMAPEALVAAGGLCAPIENVYDVRVVGSTRRPVRDAFTTFGATRGGVNLRQPPVFSDWTGAIGDWTFQNDIDAATAGGPDPTKPILEALCPGFTAFYVEATTKRVRFRNVTAKFDPEGTQANLDALAVAFARYAELKLLSKLAALSTPVTGVKAVSAARDILARLDQVIAYWRDRDRLDETVRFRLVLPQWVQQMIRTDILRGADYDLDALALADQAILDWFTRRSINVTWALDGRAANQVSATGVPAIARQSYAQVTAGGAIPGYPAQIEMFLSVEGDFLYLDAGEIDLGTVRDSSLNAVNAYELFQEEFNGLAFRGARALQIVLSTEPTGQHAGTLDTSGLTD